MIRTVVFFEEVIRSVVLFEIIRKVVLYGSESGEQCWLRR